MPELSEAFMRLAFKTDGEENQKAHANRIDAFFLVFDPMNTKVLDIDQLLNKFYQRANSRKITEVSHKFYSICEKVR